MKKYIYIIGFYLLSFQAYASSDTAKEIFGLDKVSDTFKSGGNDLVITANNMLGYIISLFYFVAIVIAIYGGFMILVSGGDEEKVKKGKNTVIYMVLGLIVIFLASNLIRWVIDVMSDEDIVGML